MGNPSACRGADVVWKLSIDFHKPKISEREILMNVNFNCSSCKSKTSGFSLWEIQNKWTGNPSVCWGADAGWKLSISFHRFNNGQICKIKSAPCSNIIAENVETSKNV